MENNDDEHEQKHKQLAQDLIQAGYKKRGSAEEKSLLDKHDLEEDPELMDKKEFDTHGNGKNRVYRHRVHKTSHVVYAGTQDKKDALTDLALGAGKEDSTPRFQKAKALADATKKKYGEDKTKAMGHSLGGALAEKSGINDVITFNRGVGKNGAFKTVKHGKHYRSEGDAVSLLAKTQKYSNGAQHIEVEGSKKKGFLQRTFDTHNSGFLTGKKVDSKKKRFWQR